MSVRTHNSEADRPARRVPAAEQVKTGAAQRAYTRRNRRVEGRSAGSVLAARDGSATAGRIPFVVAIMVMIGCGLALTLLLTTRAAEASYQLGDARAINRKLADERAALQREVAAADSPPELATRARELGMIPAQDPARLLVGPDGMVTVIGEPAPAQGTPAPPLNPPPPTPRQGPAPGERLVPVTTTTPPLPAPPAEEGSVVASPPPMSGETPGDGTPAPADGAADPAPTEGAPPPPAVPAEAGTTNPPAEGIDPAPADGVAPTPAPAAAPAEVSVPATSENAPGQSPDPRMPREEAR
ncbi:hypothetical protein [Nocardia brevicatena]|uniref:hypothetical protein n=1 Tax=Nocardia brevicatena TaxID=37327 RepID=UPI001FE0A04C|nr:hypothetical protein [Nocardia brevicatena]